MVSIAFVISFVISAVALLLGTIIFADVTEAMALTLPILDTESFLNLGQNTASTDQPINADRTNLPSVYSGLNSTDLVSSVTLPISGVNSTGGGGFLEFTGGETNISGTGAVKSRLPQYGDSSYMISGGSSTSDGVHHILWKEESTIPELRYRNISNGNSTLSAITTLETAPSSLDYFGDGYITADGLIVDVFYEASHTSGTVTETKHVRSTDGGATWGTVSVHATNNNGYYNDFNVNGNSLAIMYVAPLGFPNDVVRAIVSTNGGSTWNTQTVGDTSGTITTADEGGVIRGVGNTFYMAWSAEDVDSGNFLTYFSKSTDGGATWSTPSEEVVSDPFNEYVGCCTAPHMMFIDPANANNVNIYFVEYFNTIRVIQLKSTDSGSSFTPTVISDGNSADTCDISSGSSLDMAQNGSELHIFCQRFAGGVGDFRTTDFGSSWGVMRVIDGTGIQTENIKVYAHASGVFYSYTYYDGANYVFDVHQSIDNGATIEAQVQELFNFGMNAPQINYHLQEGSLFMTYAFESPPDNDIYTLFVESANVSFPLSFVVGIYDSADNLIGSQTGSVLADGAQNLVVTFNPELPIPVDGIVAVGINADSKINFLGDSTVSNFDDNVGLPDPFVADGTNPSSQRTIMEIHHPPQITVDEQGQVDSFEEAKNVGFTVIGVMPVALFFALFAILSPRVEGEE